MSLLEAVDAALAAEPPVTADAGVARLCRIYADLIDDDLTLVKDLGPKLLNALEALQLSPRARALARIHALGEKGPSNAAGKSPLDELRDRRRDRLERARQHDPAVVDPAAP